MGFCFGGSITWLLAVRNPEVKAAMPFYGSAPPLDEIPNMNIPVLGIYAGEGQRIGAGVPDLEADLKVNNKTYRFQTFAGANMPSSTTPGEDIIPKPLAVQGERHWPGSKLT